MSNNTDLKSAGFSGAAGGNDKDMYGKNQLKLVNWINVEENPNWLLLFHLVYFISANIFQILCLERVKSPNTWVFFLPLPFLCCKTMTFWDTTQFYWLYNADVININKT